MPCASSSVQGRRVMSCAPHRHPLTPLRSTASPALSPFKRCVPQRTEPRLSAQARLVPPLVPLTTLRKSKFAELRSGTLPRQNARQRSMRNGASWRGQRSEPRVTGRLQQEET